MKSSIDFISQISSIAGCLFALATLYFASRISQKITEANERESFRQKKNDVIAGFKRFESSLKKSDSVEPVTVEAINIHVADVSTAFTFLRRKTKQQLKRLDTLTKGTHCDSRTKLIKQVISVKNSLEKEF